MQKGAIRGRGGRDLTRIFDYGIGWAGQIFCWEHTMPHAHAQTLHAHGTAGLAQNASLMPAGLSSQEAESPMNAPGPPLGSTGTLHMVK